LAQITQNVKEVASFNHLLLLLLLLLLLVLKLFPFLA
jgi:hypothetical protein